VLQTIHKMAQQANPPRQLKINLGFYNDTIEHLRFDNAGIFTNAYGAPAIVLRKTEAGATSNQNPIPLTTTAVQVCQDTM
jgi:hypothetical protein